MKKIALIGSGNAFFMDEGMGLYAAKYLKENFTFSPHLEIVDGGTLGFKLMPLLQEFDGVIIINTASEENLKAGAIVVKDAQEFLDGSKIKKTANEVEIAEMLQICELSGNMAQTKIISIVPKDIISVAVNLTDAMKNAWHNYIDTVLKELEQFGITAIAKQEKLGLEVILAIFQEPSIEHNRGF